MAVIASNLSAAAKGREREALARGNEVTRLFDLTRDVLLTTDTATAMDILARQVARRFELSKVAIALPTDDGWRIYQGGDERRGDRPGCLEYGIRESPGTLEFDARQRTYGGHVPHR